MNVAGNYDDPTTPLSGVTGKLENVNFVFCHLNADWTAVEVISITSRKKITS